LRDLNAGGTTFEHPETETMNIAETLSYSLGTIFGDGASISENLSYNLGTIFGDGASMLETFIYALTTVKEDTVAFAETLTYLLGAVKEDTLSLVDSLTYVMLYQRTINDSAAFSETVTANLQNYVDAGYFAEDFSGTNYTL